MRVAMAVSRWPELGASMSMSVFALHGVRNEGRCLAVMEEARAARKSLGPNMVPCRSAACCSPCA